MSMHDVIRGLFGLGNAGSAAAGALAAEAITGGL